MITLEKWWRRMPVSTLDELISKLEEVGVKGRRVKGRRKQTTEADKIFDVLWEIFIEEVESPIRLDGASESEAIESLITTIAAEIDYGVYQRYRVELDANFIDWFATYLVRGTLPEDTEFDTVFFDKMEFECTEGNMEAYYYCISKAYYYVRAMKMFIKEYLPTVLTPVIVG
jgi:hypothetical protein